MGAILFLALLFFLVVHGFPWLTWVLAIIFLIGWVRVKLARLRWFRWFVRNAPR